MEALAQTPRPLCPTATRPRARRVVVVWEAIGLTAGGLALLWLALHFLLQSGWARARVEAALPAGLALDGLRRCGPVGVCAIGLSGAPEDGIALRGGVAEAALELLPPRLRGVRIHLAELSVGPPGKQPRPPRPPTPPPLAELVAALGELEVAEVRVERLWFQGGDPEAGIALAVDGLALRAQGAPPEAPRGDGEGEGVSLALAVGPWRLQLPDGSSRGGSGIAGRTRLGPEGLGARLALNGDDLAGTLAVTLDWRDSEPTLAVGGEVEAALSDGWRLRVQDLRLAPLSLAQRPEAVSLTWSVLSVGGPPGEVAAGPGRFAVAMPGLLPRVDLEVIGLTGGPLHFEGRGCARGDLARLALTFDKRLTGTLEGLALDGCSLGSAAEAPRGESLRADLLVDGGLLRGGLSGLVLHETGLLEGTLWLRRNPLGGRLSLGAEGTATLGEGALRAHLFAGLSEVPEADRAALGRTAHVKAFSVRWTREDGQVALVRELVEAALSDGGTLRWDGEGWRRDGGAPAEGDPGEPAPDGPEDQPKPP